jgi:hypothetical protein
VERDVGKGHLAMAITKLTELAEAIGEARDTVAFDEAGY